MGTNNSDAVEVHFNRDKMLRLKKGYEQALKDCAEYNFSTKQTNESTFTFEGNEYVVGYAKYLLQYLETQFGKA
jgi:hypothetical protein